jgi:hypothetical protein
MSGVKTAWSPIFSSEIDPPQSPSPQGVATIDFSDGVSK